MAENIFVTNYDRNEIIAMIREAFSEELKAIVEDQEKIKDWDVNLTRKEAAELLRVSLPTLHNFQREGLLPFAKIGSRVIIKKKDVMEAIENNIQERHRRWGNYR